MREQIIHESTTRADVMRCLNQLSYFDIQRTIQRFGTQSAVAQHKLKVFLGGALRGKYSLKVLEKQLEDKDWLVLGRPIIADLSVFAYVALAPMDYISLQPYPAVLAWIKRIEELPGFIPTEGLDDPMLGRRY